MELCTYCKQQFQNQLSIDLALAFISFTETAYGYPGNSKWDKFKVLAALHLDINVLQRILHADMERRKGTINKLLSMVDQTMKGLNMSRGIHMPRDSED